MADAASCPGRSETAHHEHAAHLPSRSPLDGASQRSPVPPPRGHRGALTTRTAWTCRLPRRAATSPSTPGAQTGLALHLPNELHRGAGARAAPRRTGLRSPEAPLGLPALRPDTHHLRARPAGTDLGIERITEPGPRIAHRPVSIPFCRCPLLPCRGRGGDRWSSTQSRCSESDPPFPRSPKEYLDSWSAPESGWLRRFYPHGSDDVHYDATPAFEKAYSWITTLRARPFVGSESRLHTVVELLRQIVHGTETDQGLRCRPSRPAARATPGMQ